MFYKVKEVKPLKDFKLWVRFIGGAVKTYDMHPIMDKFKAFDELKNNPKLFEKVKVDAGGYGIIWNERLDLSCNDLWYDGVAENPRDVMATELLCSLVAARNKNGLSQRDIEAKTGIKQPMLARIEQGEGDPQLSTLIKIATACGVRISCI